MSAFDNFLRNCKRVVDDCVRVSTTGDVQQEVLGSCIRRLEMVERSIERASRQFTDVSIQLLPAVRELLSEFRRCSSIHDGQALQTMYQSQRQQAEHGPPVYDITEAQLKFLQSCGFTAVQISHILNVSSKTVQRRLRQFVLPSSRKFAVISDGDLDATVRARTQFNDHLGPNSVCAMLAAEGIKIQRRRIRSSMLRINPLGAALRSVHRMQRRNYSVAAPNSLWHIDGNHKLIRWRFVIHGGIDGFSRAVVFLHASDNNRQDTVLQDFLVAAATFGIPSRIRVDDGGENNAICSFMEVIRGQEHNAAIRGSSVHNQRIERFWRDMWFGVTNTFYNLFYFLEDRNYLNCDNEQHLWALHYVFLPRINTALDKFQQQWNNHGIRTEHNRTPLQLFVGQALHLSNSLLTEVQEFFHHSDTSDSSAADQVGLNYRPDSAANVAADEHAPRVSVPAIPCPLSDEQLTVLRTSVDPTDSLTDSLGVTSYLKAIACIQELTG